MLKAFSKLPRSIIILVKIINGRTLGKTLNVQAEIPFIEAEINLAGEIIMQAIIIKIRIEKISFKFFKKHPLLFDIKASKWYTKNA